MGKVDAAGLMALAGLSRDWQAGPELPDSVTDHLTDLRVVGLVERHFGDMGAPVQSSDGESLTVRLRACWYFRLTPEGETARARASTIPEGEK